MFHDEPWAACGIILISIFGGIATEFLCAGCVWPGPIYLVAITISAWAFSCRIALILGFLVLTGKFTASYAGLIEYNPVTSASDIILRAMAVLVVIGVIGHARLALQREWCRNRFDTLTGALNRQAFFDIIERSYGLKGWTALIYADLDGLKKLNDSQGHDCGDSSLKHFAEKVRKTIRREDVFARLGGDEFVVCMRVKDQQGGWAAAERLRRAVNQDDASHPNDLRCSFGVLLLPHGVGAIDQELKTADGLMYCAKRDGSELVFSVATPADEKISVLPRRMTSRSAGQRALRSDQRKAIAHGE